MYIQNFKSSYYELICSWWKAFDELPVPLKHMPEETTFIAMTDDHKPLASLGYFKTNTDIALVQNFIADPTISRELRKQASTELSKFVDSHAKLEGFNILTGFTTHIKLAQRYQELGYTVKPIIFVGKEI